MRRTSARRGTPRNWRRGFDWDSVTGQISLNVGVTAVDWLRIPADNIDPSNDIFIEPKTVVKTLLWPYFQISPQAAAAYWQLWFGIIAWDWPDATAPSLAGTPDVRNGAFDWMLWLPMNGYNATGVAEHFDNEFQSASQTGGLYSDAQRKLPPGKGILYTAYFESTSPGAFCSGTFAARLGLKGDVTAVGLGGG